MGSQRQATFCAVFSFLFFSLGVLLPYFYRIQVEILDNKYTWNFGLVYGPVTDFDDSDDALGAALGELDSRFQFGSEEEILWCEEDNDDGDGGGDGDGDGGSFFTSQCTRKNAQIVLALLGVVLAFFLILVACISSIYALYIPALVTTVVMGSSWLLFFSGKQYSELQDAESDCSNTDVCSVDPIWISAGLAVVGTGFMGIAFVVYVLASMNRYGDGRLPWND